MGRCQSANPKEKVNKNYSVIMRPQAELDIDEAYRWYEMQRDGLGDAFLQSVSDALERIKENPDRYQLIHGQKRRVLLHGFPYSLFFTIVDETVAVLGCFHASRNPTVWKKRR